MSTPRILSVDGASERRSQSGTITSFVELAVSVGDGETPCEMAWGDDVSGRQVKNYDKGTDKDKTWKEKT